MSESAVPPPASAGASKRRGSRWPWVVGLVALVIAGVITVLVVGVVGSSDDDATTTGGQGPAVAGVEETTALLDGIPQDGFSIGDPKAPVTLLEYVDLQCPFCKHHQLEAQPTLIKELVRTRQAQISFVPLAFLGQQSVEARNVFFRFILRNQGWEFANLFYWNQGEENSGYVTPEFLRALVAGIDGSTPADASTSPDPRATALARSADALGRAVLTKHEAGTPGFAVGPSGAPPATYRWIELYEGQTPAEQIVKAVRAERKRVLAKSVDSETA